MELVQCFSKISYIERYNISELWMHSKPQLVLLVAKDLFVVFTEQLIEAIDQPNVLPGFRMVSDTVLGSIQGLLLGGVLLLENVEVGVDAIVGDRFTFEQFVEILPLSLEAVVFVLSAEDDLDEAIYDLKALAHRFNTNIYIIQTQNTNYITFKMFGVLSYQVPLNNVSSLVRKENTINDPLLVSHLTSILSAIQSNKPAPNIAYLSNVIKQTQLKPITANGSTQNFLDFRLAGQLPAKNRQFIVNNFKLQSQRLKWAGYGLTKQQTMVVSEQLTLVGEKNHVKEIRFWGKIHGTKLDYYVLQGQLSKIKADLTEPVKGAQKNGQGINHYTFWVTNHLLSPQWYELPSINPEHLKTARKIKKYFTGFLEEPIFSYPEFRGVEKHYLKAQLVRMSSSLEIAPKGIFKVHDENPKAIEFEQQAKVPQFAQLLSLQTWVHKNQNVLHLGRCSHFVDPSLPEDQIEAVTAELAQKDPQIERLRSINDDKLPQGSPFGVENIWQIRAVGDTQTFQKEEGSFVYGVVVLRNLYWPGWVSLGYKNGFCNYYSGYGVKWSQVGWDKYENDNLGEQTQEVAEFFEPNPREQPKVVAVVEQEQQPPEEE